MNLNNALNEALTQELNRRITSLQREIENHPELSRYLIKAMPYTYKSGYALNVMFSDQYKKAKIREKLQVILTALAKKYNAKIKSLDNDAVIKMFVKESSDGNPSN